MKNFNTIRQEALSKWAALTTNTAVPVIYLGAASCGRAAGAMSVLEAIQATLADLQVAARVVQVGCIGPCYLEPLMDIALPGFPRISYSNVTPEKAHKILAAALIEGNILPRMAKGHFGDDTFTAQSGIPRFFDLPMLKPQARVILKNCGLIDPEDIDHYLAQDGYLGFMTVLAEGPEYAITALKDSGLRGRGGAGFLTQKKWELSRNAPGSPKYVICNADEGDPGAFMNRALLESDPHAVLEGLLVGGFAIGASQGIIGHYLRPRRVSAGCHPSAQGHQAAARLWPAREEHPGLRV
jgi:(2Fe-2S) ferredoxin